MVSPEAAPVPLTRRMPSSPRSVIATSTQAWPLRCNELVPDLDTSATARQEYLDLLRAQLPGDIEGGEDAPPPSLLEGDADTAFERAGRAGALTGAGRAGGGAAGFSLGGFTRAARNLLNSTTYYTMRDRAGKVGANGIAPLLEQLQGDGRRIHLVGHSFGARAATAAANATNAPVHALVLLQGAFSHYASPTIGMVRAPTASSAPFPNEYTGRSS